jgi:hypothetical protein
MCGSFSPRGEKVGIAYMDVGKGREQERKLEGDAFRLTPHPCPLPKGERVYWSTCSGSISV